MAYTTQKNARKAALKHAILAFIPTDICGVGGPKGQATLAHRQFGLVNMVYVGA